ncbi:PREDICTED: uncharacterized protein LOC105448326 isoform X2 [Wasmannia auropunctata]|uniref:uncharacterized protein LOC105448326 isoform X2 n=1 Tax=Wasmannia auropunctata TaxID=64793 RepID=UPI0005EF0A77|nr:PREDICTED: uncharacterized protein LOC105448326 isoform X2 [Wasmannia auropunctata]
MHLNEYNYENDSHNGSRDKEMWHLLEKLNKVVTKEEFRTLHMEFMEYHRIINNKLDRLLRKQSNIMPPKPPSFPLQSVQEVTNFNNISQEEYDNAVQYLHFIGGFTLHDTVKYCMKEVMTDDTIKHYSAWGERGNLPLFDTKVIRVIYDAVCMNTHFERPLRDEFFREVAEAVRFGKQRNRNMNRRTNIIIRGRGRRQRLRNEADNHLLDNGDFNEDNIDDGNSADNEN